MNVLVVVEENGYLSYGSYPEMVRNVLHSARTTRFSFTVIDYFYPRICLEKNEDRNITVLQESPLAEQKISQALSEFKDKALLVRFKKILQLLCHKLLRKIIRDSRIEAFFFCRYLSKLMRMRSFDGIIYFGASLEAGRSIVRFMSKCDVKIISMLTDPFFYNPSTGGNKRSAKKLEGKLISKSEYYFVPEDTFLPYKCEFKSERIVPYKIPLYPVYKKPHLRNHETNDSKRILQCSYFGFLQPERQREWAFKKLENDVLKIDCYVGAKTKSQLAKNIWLHPFVFGDELYKAALDADILLVFDNDAERKTLLPSKCLFYSSLYKPVIVFGESPDSAAAHFFSYIGHPAWFYCRQDTDLSQFLEFVNANPNLVFPKSYRERTGEYHPYYFGKTFWQKAESAFCEVPTERRKKHSSN